MRPLPIINLVIDIRRELRTWQAQLNEARSECRRLRRQAKKLQQASPFNHARAADLLFAAKMIDASRKVANEFFISIGRYLINVAPEFDAATTLEERCEILNVNVADRADLLPEHGLVEIVNIYGLEDSAFYRNSIWKSGPLFEAINGEIMRVMFKTPEGRAKSKQLTDELFAPGGLFYGVPTYYQQPDGAMLRKAPALTVHDADGARVIERKPTR